MMPPMQAANETTAKTSAVVKRLEYLSGMLTKYAHCWGEHPSVRMVAWVDEYNKLKATHDGAWREYCEKHDFALTHNGYDCMA
jgi:hypothetical protein